MPKQRKTKPSQRPSLNSASAFSSSPRPRFFKAWPPQLGLAAVCIGGAVFTAAAALQSTAPSSPKMQDYEIAPQVIPDPSHRIANETSLLQDSPQLLGASKLKIADLPPVAATTEDEPISFRSSPPRRSSWSQFPLNPIRQRTLPSNRPTRSPSAPQTAASSPASKRPHRSLFAFLRRDRDQTQGTSPTAQRRAAPLPLTLSDAIALTLANNRSLKNAYLERIAQRAELAVAESTFTPRLIPRVEGRIDGAGIDGIDRSSQILQLSANVAIKLPTGGEFQAGWAANAQNRDAVGQGISLNFRQPLLRNSGVAVNTADLKVARLQEQINVLALQEVLSDTITETILAYRNLLRTQEQIIIQESALENANALLERDRALVEAGRIAKVDLVQSEAQVARVEVDLVEARNAVEQARLDLINLLDIDSNTNLVAVEKPLLEPFEFDSEQLRQFMFANRPQFQQSQFALQQAELALLKAEDNRRWNLDLEAGYGETRERVTDVRAGLVVSREIGNPTIESNFQRRRVELLQVQNNAIELQETLDIELANRLREVQLSYERVQLAIQSRELAARNLEIEQQRRALGSSDIDTLINVQNRLVSARNAELNATIDYFNARSQLDRTIGNTLNTWGVAIVGEANTEAER
jgi:outer membrane protein TolC